MAREQNRTVYSSEQGDLRQKPATKPGATRSLPLNQQTVYLHRDSKGRGGKVVTVLKNLQLTPDDMKSLTKQLKQACGTGGTIKENMIEIQGDHREKIAETLQKLGYKTKIAGG